MGFRQADLQPAFDISGTYPFRIWGYGTADNLEEVLGPGYMRGGATILRPGDLIYVRSCPRRAAGDGRAAGARRSGATTGGRFALRADTTSALGASEGEPAVRVALLMAVGWERNAMRLRLVQDFGRPEDDAMPVRGGEARPSAPAPILIAPPLSKAPGELPGPTPAASTPALAAPAFPQASLEPPAPAPAAPARRGRGRPPGSRNKKAVFPGLRAGFR